MRILAGVLIVNELQELLLLHRRPGTAEGVPAQWELPGGMVREGEDHRHAAARELQRETHLQVDPDALALSYATTFAEPGQNRHYLYKVFTPNTSWTMRGQLAQLGDPEIHDHIRFWPWHGVANPSPVVRDLTALFTQPMPSWVRECGYA